MAPECSSRSPTVNSPEAPGELTLPGDANPAIVPFDRRRRKAALEIMLDRDETVLVEDSSMILLILLFLPDDVDTTMLQEGSKANAVEQQNGCCSTCMLQSLSRKVEMLQRRAHRSVFLFITGTDYWVSTEPNHSSPPSNPTIRWGSLAAPLRSTLVKGRRQRTSTPTSPRSFSPQRSF
jgi:hypothetical protein